MSTCRIPKQHNVTQDDSLVPNWAECIFLHSGCFAAIGKGYFAIGICADTMQGYAKCIIGVLTEVQETSYPNFLYLQVQMNHCSACP